MLHSRKKWRLLNPSDQQIDELVQQLNVDQLSARLLQAHKESMGLVLEDPHTIFVHSVCRLTDLSVQVLQEYVKNNPCQGMEELRLLLLGAKLLDFRRFGENQQHLKLTVQQDQIEMECIGYHFGESVREITPHAIANLVVEPAIREWNGVYKVQLVLHDMEITEMQIFDLRETKNKSQRLQEVENQDTLIICFREESKQSFLQTDLQSGIALMDEMLYPTYLRGAERLYTQIILYDTPYSMGQFRAGLALVPKPERIYCLFGEEYTNRLAVIPSRDQFKWLYGIIYTRKRLTDQQIPLLAKSKNLREQNVQFMLQVFEELGFITKREGEYWIKEAPVHKALTESRTYQRKLTEMEMETEILYASYGILCKAIKEVTL